MGVVCVQLWVWFVCSCGVAGVVHLQLWVWFTCSCGCGSHAGIKGTVRRNQDGHFIHANIDLDIIITEEVGGCGHWSVVLDSHS